MCCHVWGIVVAVHQRHMLHNIWTHYSKLFIIYVYLYLFIYCHYLSWACEGERQKGNSSISLSVSPPFKVRNCWCLTQSFLFGFKPFSIEVKFSIHVEAELFNCFSRLCLILAFKTFSKDCLPFPYPSLFSTGVRACWKQWNNICMLLVIINYTDSVRCGHLRESLLRLDISSISWKSGEYTVVAYTGFICSCPETSISQTHLYLS